jgi:DNA polymerase
MKFTEALSKMTRGIIVPRKGMKFYVGDFVQIEMRVLAWSAGDLEKLALAASGVDMYKRQASHLYGVPIEDVTKDQRQAAKSGELAFQYGGGIGSMATFSKTFGVDLTPIYYDLWQSATPEEKDKAEWSYDFYMRKDPEDPLVKPAALAADILKQRWRRSNPITVQHWANLEAATVRAIETGEVVSCGRSQWFTNDIFLYLRLPSGRDVAYPFYYLKGGKTERSKKSFGYKGTKDGRYQHISTYGGKLAENETQAISRDILTKAILRLEGVYPVAFHAHDEIISEVPVEYDDRHFEHFKQLMAHQEAWTQGIPIAVDAKEMNRYGKI